MDYLFLTKFILMRIMVFRMSKTTDNSDFFNQILLIFVKNM